MTLAPKLTPGDGSLTLSCPLPEGTEGLFVKVRAHGGAWAEPPRLAVSALVIAPLVNGVLYDVQVTGWPAGGTVTVSAVPGVKPAPVPPTPVVS
jgi:hypothetical protein